MNDCDIIALRYCLVVFLAVILLYMGALSHDLTTIIISVLLGGAIPAAHLGDQIKNQFPPVDISKIIG